MIIVHHLNNSRSQRILWLLEELGLEYEVKPYQRRQPDHARAARAARGAPARQVAGRVRRRVTLAESGAIIEYLSDRYGAGKLAPAPNTPERFPYL
jgi:glutathione S-transferase